MNTHHLLLTATFLASIIVSAVSCSDPGPSADATVSASTTSAEPSLSSDSTSPEATATASNSKSPPVATNKLILVKFPAAEGPSNHDGKFRPGEFEAEIGFRNSSPEPIAIGAAEVINFDEEAFFLTSDGCAGKILTQGGACVLWLQFRPSDADVYSGQLVIHMPASNSYQVLELTGGEAATTTASPSSSPPPASGIPDGTLSPSSFSDPSTSGSK